MGMTEEKKKRKIIVVNTDVIETVARRAGFLGSEAEPRERERKRKKVSI